MTIFIVITSIRLIVTTLLYIPGNTVMLTLSVSVPTVLVPTQVYAPLSLTVKLVIDSSPLVLIIVLSYIHYETH